MLHASLFPQPETTGTASFTAGLAYGVSAGLLDSQTFAPAVWQAWNFLSETALNSSGFVGHCQKAGGDPTNTYDALPPAFHINSRCHSIGPAVTGVQNTTSSGDPLSLSICLALSLSHTHARR